MMPPAVGVEIVFFLYRANLSGQTGKRAIDFRTRRPLLRTSLRSTNCCMVTNT